MKFITEDKVGRKLADTLGQELFSASDNYQTFMQCSMFLKTHDDRFLKVRAYLAYSNMLRSLYEYYIGIFKFRDGDTKQLSPDTVDQRMNKVARNLLNFYRPIEGFINPSFPDAVPVEFGKDFRTIRNRISHADHRRMQSLDERTEVSLSEFYTKYHFVITKMITHPQFSWDGEKYAGYEWAPVHEFSETLKKNA